MISKSRNRALLLCLICGGIFTCLSIRLCWVQVVRHEKFSGIAEETHTFRKQTAPRRGMILARDGEPLVTSIPAKRIILDGSQVSSPQALAEFIAPYLERDAAELTALIEENVAAKRKYKVIEGNFPVEKAHAMSAAIEEENNRRAKMGMKTLLGISYENDTRRDYPNGSILSQVIGHMGREKEEEAKLTGKQGIEKRFEHQLAGLPGYIYSVKDRRGAEIRSYRKDEQDAVNGSTIQLTIDMNIQTIVETTLDRIYKTMRPASANIIIADPWTDRKSVV